MDEAVSAVELAITNVRLLCEELLNNRLYQMDNVLADVRLLAESKRPVPWKFEKLLTNACQIERMRYKVNVFTLRKAVQLLT